MVRVSFFIIAVLLASLACHHQPKELIDPPEYCSSEIEPKAECNGFIKCAADAVCVQDRCVEPPVFFPVTKKSERVVIMDAFCFDTEKMLSSCDGQKLPRLWAHYDSAGRIAYGTKKTGAAVEHPVCGIKKPKSSKAEGIHVTFCRPNGRGGWNPVVLESVPALRPPPANDAQAPSELK